MTRYDINETIDIPEGVTVSLIDNVITVKGPKGELSREIQARGVAVKVEGKTITLEANAARRNEKKLLFTYKAHINNMLAGVQEEFLYKLKICSGHFPMNVTLKGMDFEIKNFIGEKVPRQLKIKEGAEVKINGDIIEVRSINKETAGQVAADIEKLTRRAGFDRRIFQDGIYITEKNGKTM